MVCRSQGFLSHPNLTGMNSRHRQVVPNGHQGLQFPWGTKCLRQQECQTQCSMKEPRPVVVPHINSIVARATGANMSIHANPRCHLAWVVGLLPQKTPHLQNRTEDPKEHRI